MGLSMQLSMCALGCSGPGRYRFLGIVDSGWLKELRTRMLEEIPGSVFSSTENNMHKAAQPQLLVKVRLYPPSSPSKQASLANHDS
jgi:hypothetical protein